MSGTSEYLAEHIRIALADGAPHQMGLNVHVDDEEIRLRGRIDSDDDRAAILQIVYELAQDRRVVDDLESADVDPSVRTERVE